MSESSVESINQSIVHSLINDHALQLYWSDVPICNCFPYRNSDTLKAVTLTIFVREECRNREKLGTICHRVILLARPHVILINEIKGIQVWVGMGDSRATMKKTMCLSVMKESFDSALLASLSDCMIDEYFEKDGIRIVRYCIF